MADNEPLVSVGIPAYNRPEGLRTTLESITRQTYKNLEIIVSDNCSPDPNVEHIARDFQKLDNRIQYFRQTENTGAMSNFRFVLGKARGEYFMWAADDDFISEDFIWQAIQFFEEHSGYAIVSGTPFTVTRRGKHRANNGHSFTGKFGVLRVLQTYNARGMIAVYGLINTAALRRIRIGNRFAEDRYIVASLAYMGKIKTLETMRLYRSPGISRNVSDMHRRMLESVGIRFRGVALARLMMATNASKDIFVQKEVYRGLSFPAKVLLALCCFVVSIYNSIKIFYVGRYVGRIVHMAGKRIGGSLRFKNDSKTEGRRFKAELDTSKRELTVETSAEVRIERDYLRVKRELELVKDSISYQLGSAIIQALHKPGRNTILLPCRLIRLFVMGFKKRKIKASRGIPRRDKYTEIRLGDVKLSTCTAMIKKKYIERFGVDKGRLGWYGENDWKRIEHISSLLPEAKSVLDIGISNGAFLNLLISINRFQRILGIDIIRHPQFTRLFGSHLYQIMYASVIHLPFADKSIDVVTCMEVLEHLDRQSFLAALHELRRVSRFLIATVPYNEPEPLPSYHKQRFTDNDLLTHFPHGDFILLKKSAGTSWIVIVERS